VQTSIRVVHVAGDDILTTPLMVPSYSSRAIPPNSLATTFGETIELIGGPVLVSAYDVHYQGPIVGEGTAEALLLDEVLAERGLPLIFLDSGGYEARWNRDAVEAKLLEAADAQPWAREMHAAVLDRWPSDLRVMAVTYDNPAEDTPAFEAQFERASELMQQRPEQGCELLLKPPFGKPLLDMKELQPHLGRLPAVDVMGVTEKECGDSMAERVCFVRDLRAGLDAIRPDIPIHVFGGLDPLMTPLYFLAGADIFDGLTWLRYAYQNGQSLYPQGFIAGEMPFDSFADGEWLMRQRNLQEMVNLEIGLKSFATSLNPNEIGPQGQRLVEIYNSCAR
jgi:hypothetical protein